ncbi:HEAT repeat domain-containing protein [Sorangium sp. So ce1097]|uniref:HEAT repeat domain-containing protein n=1 Tax=Sorangium sp. So ce1097 TaxID=3133330 RepID=UPI003F628249
MRSFPGTPRALAVAVALAAVTIAGAAAAQPVARTARAPERADDRGAASAAEPGATPLRGSLGVPVAERLLASSDPEARLRGIERLGAIGTEEAVNALLAALEQGAPGARDPRARLAAVRALAPHAARDSVRQLLARELSEGGAPARSAASPLGELLRGTAALALARSGDRRALGALVNAIVQGGAAGEAAARALEAYPPASLQLLLGSRKRIEPALVAFLGELGDLRAMGALRPMLEGGDRAAQVAAARALARLGDEAALAKARAWLRSPEPGLLEATAEILVHLGAPEAPDAVAALLGSERARLDGLRLAELAPSERLVPALARALPLLPEDARPRAVAAIGRAGGAEAARQLRELLARPELATAAAFALATAPGAEARAAVAEMIEGARAARDADHRRLGLRAGVVRGLTLGDAPEALEGRLLAALAAPRGSSDRAVGVFGAVALGLRGAGEVVGACSPASCDRAAVHAAARGALARGERALAALAPLFAELAAPGGGGAASSAKSGDDAPPDAAAISAGVALLAAPGGGAVATSRLAALAEAGGPLAPLAARALAARDDEVIRGRLKRLLEGSDPVVRAHVALGLGGDPLPDSVSLLARAYRFEDDPAVRRAIVRGLSRRTEVQRGRVLAAARDLDPDEGVRALARAALAGNPRDPRAPSAPARALDAPRPALATGVVWVTIVPNDRSAAASAASRPARLVRPDGVAVPVVADPDGVLLVPAVPPGVSSVLLAPAAPPGDAGP